LFLAVAIGIAGYFIGNTLFKANTSVNVAEVKGLSERIVQADQAQWVIGFLLSADGDANVAALYASSEQQQQRIIALLKKVGFSDENITTEAPFYSVQEHRNHLGVVSNISHHLRGQVTVNSDNVKLVESSRAKVSDLIADGIILENNPPVYQYTKLNDIKPEMVKDATDNARSAAQEFAKNAGVSVGKIKSARQGSFEIRDLGEEYGNRNKIDKTVRVVTTISFYLHD
jgi:hypothetical protein